MKNLILALAFLVTGVITAQDINKPTIVKKGDLIQATYYFENGNVAQTGYFNKDNKLQGVWTKYDVNGNKVAVGNYENGKKVGKWFFWTNDILREVDYSLNSITSVNTWKNTSAIADRD
ncbi:nicotinic acid mononucleotide adenyltransferase [Mesoflavibacter profundi]|uniref:Nicotinic acid mononucleotide adenyltransferase n=1 Tax=Mesoflavibacter profundi TaxID=2708110 RepID=A0ABT4S373_9FLAO|nr:nicotinic acid mononucleotide adenyltransferase [Mesoflavibacter profundi]MDA0178210.1 nicotinic acid mononucleotide adenyltransferase [Mesoflavibacter profundi]